ncbi:MAG: hydroxysqualene dehydroxylase HpnE [Ideonella sp.]
MAQARGKLHSSSGTAVIGAGWAGLAAAVELIDSGRRVTLFEMAAQAGGRARQVPGHETLGGLDNGQHILIGAYSETLALMRRVGAEPDQMFWRSPLRLMYPDGSGLALTSGPAIPAFVRGVIGQHRWSWRDRFALLSAAIGWRLRGFACAPSLSVAELTASLPAGLRRSVIDPLCVAALNTPSDQASAAVFLRILRDALFAGPGAADLLLPRQRLSALLPSPALAHLAGAGADLRLGHRVRELTRCEDQGWRVDGEEFGTVVLAATSTETARLVAEISPPWATTASALQFEPIVTVSVRSEGTRLPMPMMALHTDPIEGPAQFVFDQGQLDGADGLLTLVISGASPWLARGIEVTTARALEQVRHQLGGHLRSPLQVLQVLTDKRATFCCTPGLQRPPMQIADGLLAAGDYIEGPYPATLEGAVRSGLAAARATTRV